MTTNPTTQTAPAGRKSADQTTARPYLYLGCTVARHKQIGIHAIVNARAGRLSLNEPTMQEIEMQRDARAVQDIIQRRLIVRQFGSRPFRRRLSHLLSVD